MGSSNNPYLNGDKEQLGIGEPPNAGEYRCIVIDPPWDQGKTGLRTTRPNQGQALDYPTMTFQQIATLPIQKWAAPNAFLWLWATNSRSKSSGRPILRQAFDLLDKWGFQYYTLLTWDKKTGPAHLDLSKLLQNIACLDTGESVCSPKIRLGR